MDLYRLLNLLERVEGDVSALYKKLHDDYILNKEVADFFLEMYYEEETHIQFVRMERRIIQSAPKVFKEVNINLSEINSLLENVANLKAAKLDLPAVIGRIYSIEYSLAEKYLINALKDTNDDLREFLIQLSSTFNTHTEKVAMFAARIGVQIEQIANRYLRKARVEYGEKVLINSSDSVKGVDLSEGGMFLLTGRTFRAGDRLSVQFQVLNLSITADAIVQFMIDDVGIGIKFTGIQQKDRDTISRYVIQRLEEKGIDKQKRLLLVGSDREAGRDVRYYVHELISSGYKVVDLSGLEEAVSTLSKGIELSCIVLMIENSTDPNYYLLRFLPTMERYKNIPVIVITTDQQKELQKMLLRSSVIKTLVRSSTSPKRLLEEVNNISA